MSQVENEFRRFIVSLFNDDEHPNFEDPEGNICSEGESLSADEVRAVIEIATRGTTEKDRPEIIRMTNSLGDGVSTQQKITHARVLLLGGLSLVLIWGVLIQCGLYAGNTIKAADLLGAQTVSSRSDNNTDDLAILLEEFNVLRASQRINQLARFIQAAEKHNDLQQWVALIATNGEYDPRLFAKKMQPDELCSTFCIQARMQMLPPRSQRALIPAARFMREDTFEVYSSTILLLERIELILALCDGDLERTDKISVEYKLKIKNTIKALKPFILTAVKDGPADRFCHLKLLSERIAVH